MTQIIVFAGTTEGRILSEKLARAGVETVCCVATEYGRAMVETVEGLTVREGRMDEKEMREFFEREGRPLVLDATHPYAVIVSENIRKACEETSCEYIRCARPESCAGIEDGCCLTAGSVEEAVEILKDTDGKILVTTGSKELAKFTALPDSRERVYARVLPSTEVVAHCSELGFDGRHLICMQGPFTKEMNVAMIRQIGAKYLVSKDSGAAGGFDEKLGAAQETGAKLVLIGRPAERDGRSLEECVRLLEERFGAEMNVKMPDDVVSCENGRTARLVGIGMGGADGMTREAAKAFEDADCIIGARRMLEPFKNSGAALCEEYDSAKIVDFLREHPGYKNIAVSLSGDVGFYSGAAKLVDALESEGFSVELIPGVSSAVCLFSRLHMPWEDARLVSMHGRGCNIVATVKRNLRTFVLLGGNATVNTLCSTMIEYGLTDVTVYVGERLGYENEKISSGKPEDLINGVYENLCAAVIENPAYFPGARSGIPDDEFERGDAPMTKSEVRCLSVSKLALSAEDIVYDIGAGTGSVTVEAALLAYEGQVYAIEKKPEAASLISVNCRKFGVSNVEVVEGEAPAAMVDLPRPTHAFIGGSSGNLREILEALLEKNPGISVVINAVTMETVEEANRCLNELPFTDIEVTQVQINRTKKVGRYNMFRAQNPVYIFSARGAALLQSKI